MGTELERITVTIYPQHIATLQQISREHGESGVSAAVRWLIEEYEQAQRNSNGKDTDDATR